MRHAFAIITVAFLITACAPAQQQAPVVNQFQQTETQTCELMPAIVEKTCLAANQGDQYASVLMLDDAAFKLEMQSLESPYLEALPLIRKLQSGEGFSEIEALELQSFNPENFTASFSAVVRFAQKMQAAQAKALQLTQENEELKVEVEKQAELIKRLKDLSLGR